MGVGRQPASEWVSVCLEEGKKLRDSELAEAAFVGCGQMRTPTAVPAGTGCWCS